MKGPPPGTIHRRELARILVGHELAPAGSLEIDHAEGKDQARGLPHVRPAVSVLEHVEGLGRCLCCHCRLLSGMGIPVIRKVWQVARRSPVVRPRRNVKKLFERLDKKLRRPRKWVNSRTMRQS